MPCIITDILTPEQLQHSEYVAVANLDFIGLFIPSRFDIEAFKLRFPSIHICSIRHPENDWTLCTGCTIELNQVIVDFAGYLISLDKFPFDQVTEEFGEKYCEIVNDCRLTGSEIRRIEIANQLGIDETCSGFSQIFISKYRKLKTFIAQELDLTKETNHLVGTHKNTSITIDQFIQLLVSCPSTDDTKQIDTEIDLSKLRKQNHPMFIWLKLIQTSLNLLFKDRRASITTRITEAITILSMFCKLWKSTINFTVPVDELTYYVCEIYSIEQKVICSQTLLNYQMLEKIVPQTYHFEVDTDEKEFHLVLHVDQDGIIKEYQYKLNLDKIK